MVVKAVPKGMRMANLAWGFSGGGKDDDTDAELVIVDLGAKQSVIDGLKEQGKMVICYFSVGTLEPFRQDCKDNAQAWLNASVGKLDGFHEYWLDISQLDKLVALMEPRFREARDKGCDGVEPDNIDCFLDTDCYRNLGVNQTVTYSEAMQYQLAYDRWQVETAHNLDLSIGMKNAKHLMDELVDLYDFAVNEQCYQDSYCYEYRKFLQRNKAVFNFEYVGEYMQWCPDKPINPNGMYLCSKVCEGNSRICTSGSWKTCYIDIGPMDFSVYNSASVREPCTLLIIMIALLFVFFMKR